MTTDFGKQIKHKLIEMDRPQTWLIERVREQTGLYFDSAYLQKIMTGKTETPGMVAAIRSILHI